MHKPIKRYIVVNIELFLKNIYFICGNIAVVIIIVYGEKIAAINFLLWMSVPFFYSLKLINFPKRKLLITGISIHNNALNFLN